MRGDNMMEFDEALLKNKNEIYRKIFESRRDPYLFESGRSNTEFNYPLPKVGQK